MTDEARVPSGLGELFAAQLKVWSRASLDRVAAAQGDFGEPAPELVDWLLAKRVEIGAWLSAARDARGEGFERAPAAFLARLLLRWLWQKNQFFEIGAAAQVGLENQYRIWLEQAGSLLVSELPETQIASGLRAIFRLHRELVASLVRERLGPNPRDVVASEYSPQLELSILGLTPEKLLDPILDVGCGRTAALVRLLRAHGHVALGIDRDAPSDVATVADWLSFDFGEGRFGTVLSHLGFSLHFLHHHLKNDENAFVYAHAYMRILRSLKVGGTFAYAPALPFIEALLPEATYACDTGALPETLRTETILRVERTTSLALGTASRIRRIA